MKTNRIFIIEGILTVVVSLFAYFIVPTWPHTAKFVGLNFSSSESLWLVTHTAQWWWTEQTTGKVESRFRCGPWRAFQVVLRPTSHQWSSCLGLCILVPRFLLRPIHPQPLHGKPLMSWNFCKIVVSIVIANHHRWTWFRELASATVRFNSRSRNPRCFDSTYYYSMTVPPNALASISIWLTVWLSSKYNLRAPFIIASAIVAIIGMQIFFFSPGHNADVITSFYAYHSGHHTRVLACRLHCSTYCKNS